MMKSYLYIWNPNNWEWLDLQDAIHKIKNDKEYDTYWSCGRTKRIKIGDRFFLMRLGIEPKGIVACGYVSSTPYDLEHWNSELAAEGKTTLRTDLLFKALDNNPIVPLKNLQDKYPEYNWTPQSGGMSIPDEISFELWKIIQENPDVGFIDEKVMDYPQSFYSWTLISPDKAEKTMDKSSFIHGGSAIPRQIIHYFQSSDGMQQTPVRIALDHEGKRFEAKIVLTSLNRYQLLWSSELSKLIQYKFPEYFTAFDRGDHVDAEKCPSMIFSRISNDTYEVAWNEVLTNPTADTNTVNEWTDEELHAAVIAYFEMLAKEKNGEPYNKADVNRQLREEVLSNRSKQSIEFRMANISSILSDLCHAIIDGYKPRGHVGADVKERILKIISDEKMINIEDSKPTDDETDLDQRVSNLLKRGLSGKPKGQIKPKTGKSSQTIYSRDPQVKAWVLNNAKGICELCGNMGPFLDRKTDYPFLEVHHIVPLAEDGSDTIENAAGLCPNCHRKSHLSENLKNIKKELLGKITR